MSSWNTSTDFDGNYSFRSVQPGEYVVAVALAGYSSDYKVLSMEMSRLAPEQQAELLKALPSVIVRNGSVRKDVVIRRGAAITGHVLVDTGGTLAGQSVWASMVSGDLFIDSANHNEPVDIGVLRAETDDRGMYRIAGLPKGKYRIRVEVRSEHKTGGGSMDVFAPAALKEDDSKLISVDYGDEVSDVDITVPTARLHSIGGAITQGGVPVPSVSLTISQDGKRGSRTFSTDSSGIYRVDLLLSGTYTLEAIYPVPESQVHQPRVKRKITIQLFDSDVLDANIDLPQAGSAVP